MIKSSKKFDLMHRIRMQLQITEADHHADGEV